MRTPGRCCFLRDLNAAGRGPPDACDPTAFTYWSCHQQAQPPVGAGVDLEDRHPPPDLNAFQVKARDESVIGETEGEVGIVV
jgi:hypothetical protein